ncbi:hypothetical protein A2V71_01275 [Candidatus Berkelbacteria bacterium RBG_13_40_8]|uniref:Activator of Hsp90 ATPase homologue 1/2-like C-terminal domain-containing protein n=1 Tax=Candidatus Berkelbacteria bacterium RBG_13_40_8 TaxID=1797467 RepID=A0A1F5DME7_9BACT|nr:MAG: hypothetical protein A2V71_01275 [Candidatus Berkelbacteria bacterium RBG_13_40_8]
MKTKTISQTVRIKASPGDVYESLMDSKKHSEITGDKAEISKVKGGLFSTFGGYAKGKNLELVPNQKIVQTWRADNWSEGHFSKITIELKKIGPETQLKFTQEDVPDFDYVSVAQGWEGYYWGSMKKYLEK